MTGKAATRRIRLSILLAAGIFPLLLSGCSHRKTIPEQTLNYARRDEPRHLDPTMVTDLFEGIVSGFVYDSLVEFGQGSEVVPGLARDWTVSPDGKTYTFHLRDARFGDGRPVTSADVRYSLTRVLKPATSCERKWVLDRILGADAVIHGSTDTLEGLKTPDDRTVVITLGKSYPVFLKMLAMPTAAIIPNGSAGTGKPDPAFDRKPIGTGPWVLTKWIHEQKLEFARNPHYWGEGPFLGKMVYHIQSQDNVRYRQFEAGNFDIVKVGFQVIDSWTRDPAKARLTTSIQELRTDFIGLMCSKKPLDDVRVRQAISHAIDVETIFHQIQKDQGVISAGPIPPGIPGYRPDRKPVSFAPEKARALLAEAGVSNLNVSLWFRDEAMNAEIVDAVRNDLQKVGIHVTLVSRDQAALRDAIHSGQADMYLGSWTLDYPDPENALYPPFHSRNIPYEGNQSHFRDAEVDRLLDEARSTSNESNRITLYEKVEDRVDELVPWICLFHPRTCYAVQPGVSGWSPALMYNADRFNTVRKKKAPQHP